jgi:hypothetical protein
MTNTLSVFGTVLADAGSADLVLWKVRQPFRISSWLTGMDVYSVTTTGRGDLRASGDVGSAVRFVAYACNRGQLRMTIAATAPATIDLRSDDALATRRRVRAWSTETLIARDDWRTRGRSVRALRVGRLGGLGFATTPLRQCTFDLSTTASLRVYSLSFRRYR